MSQTPIPPNIQSTEHLAIFTFPEHWLSVVSGAIFALTRGRRWDGRTGNIKQAQETGQQIWESFSSMPIQDVVDAINNISGADLSVTNTKLQAIVDKLTELEVETDQLGQSVETALNYAGKNLSQHLSEVSINQTVNVDDSASVLAIDGLAADLRDATSQGILNAQNIADVIAGDIGSQFGQFLLVGGEGEQTTIGELVQQLAITQEAARVYEGDKLAFYGQTMTTQTGALKEIADAIRAIQMSYTLLCQSTLSGGPTPPLPAQEQVASDWYLNALVVHTMIGSALQSLADVLPDGLLVPQALVTTYVDYVVIAALEFISFDIGAIELSARDLIETAPVQWSWAAVVSEWQALDSAFVCYYGQQPFNTNDPEIITTDLLAWTAGENASASLQQALAALGTIDVMTYIQYTYLGGGSRPTIFSNFEQLKNQLSDGYDPLLWETCQ